MKLESILAHIRSMRDREGVKRIISAAEARESKLGSIEGERERTRLWRKVERLDLKAGDMVFIHLRPQDVRGQEAFSTGQHKKLWGKALTVREVKPRVKEIVVRAPGSNVDHRLSPFTCERLKLSKEPTPEALANALRKETLADPRAYRAKLRRDLEDYALNA